MAIPSTVKIVKDGVEKLMLSLAALDRDRVRVGVPSKASGRQDEDYQTNAALAYLHDRGSPGGRIPARPFLIPGIRSVQDKIDAVLGKGAKNALDGKGNAEVEKSLTRAGLVAQAGIKKYIVAGNFKPLSPVTIIMRQLGGFAGTKPLIRTGQLLNSINYVIRRKGQR